MAVVYIIQSECWSPDISGVYGSIVVKFCEKVGLMIKGAENTSILMAQII